MTEYGIKELKRRVKENKVLTFEERKYINKALEEIQAYRAIGTVEECRTAVERMKPKKPNQISKAMDKGTFVGLIGRCPNCGSIVAEDNFVCEDCFQVLDWSE